MTVIVELEKGFDQALDRKTEVIDDNPECVVESMQRLTKQGWRINGIRIVEDK